MVSLKVSTLVLKPSRQALTAFCWQAQWAGQQPRWAGGGKRVWAVQGADPHRTWLHSRRGQRRTSGQQEVGEVGASSPLLQKLRLHTALLQFPLLKIS